MAPVCRHWRLWILPVSAGLYAVSIVSLVPILLATSTWASSKKKNQAALIGGAFVLLTLPIALYEIVQHMIHYTHPGLQKHVIRWVNNSFDQYWCLVLLPSCLETCTVAIRVCLALWPTVKPWFQISLQFLWKSELHRDTRYIYQISVNTDQCINYRSR